MLRSRLFIVGAADRTYKVTNRIHKVQDRTYEVMDRIHKVQDRTFKVQDRIPKIGDMIFKLTESRYIALYLMDMI